LLIPAAQRLHREHPLLDVRILEVETSDAYERLLAGDVDIAITLPNLGGPTADDPRFEQRPLLDEPQDLLVPVEHRLAGRAEVALEEVAHDDWVLPEPHSCDQYDLTVLACSTAGFTPRVAHHAMEWAATFELVAHGFGVCMKPRPVPVSGGLPVAQIPLREPTPRRRLLTATRRGSRDQRAIAVGLDALTWAADRAAPAGRSTPSDSPV
jgi:DNA-binding transcriptional LysR family regulator